MKKLAKDLKQGDRVFLEVKPDFYDWVIIGDVDQETAVMVWLSYYYEGRYWQDSYYANAELETKLPHWWN